MLDFDAMASTSSGAHLGAAFFFIRAERDMHVVGLIESD